MNEFVECRAFVQIEPRTRYSDGRPGAVAATLITQKRPDWPQRGSVVIAVTFRVPATAFMPLRPSATIEIPENFALTVPLEVEAVDANDVDTEGGAL